MRGWIGSTALFVLALAGCAPRPAVLPPPAPSAGLPQPAPPPTEPVNPARRQEEAVERVDVTALQDLTGAANSSKETPVAEPDRIVLQVRVVDEAGRAVGNVSVVVRSLSGGEDHRGRTDAQGLVGLGGLAPGDYLVSTEPADFAEVAAIPVRLTAGRVPDTVEIRLRPTAGTEGADAELARPLVLA